MFRKSNLRLKLVHLPRVLLLTVLSLVALSANAGEQFTIKDTQCGGLCALEFAPIGKFYSIRVYDSLGEVVAIEPTQVSDSAPLNSDLQLGSIPAPPASGTGTISIDGEAPGMDASGQLGTWFLTASYLFIDFKLRETRFNTSFVADHTRPRGIPGDGDNS